MKGDFVCAATQKGEDKLRPYHWSVPCRGDPCDRPRERQRGEDFASTIGQQDNVL